MVCVRARPMMPKEKLAKSKMCLKFLDDETVMLGANRTFQYDYALGPDCPQDKVYSLCVKRLVAGCFLGYNATVFAYGQTGSGKTYTMGSADPDDTSYNGLSPQQGIIPRVVLDLFETIAQNQQPARDELQQARTDFQLRVSYLEIYNEEVRDLLHPANNKGIDIRENTQGDIVVMGASEESADSVQV
jgi:hypothetical protein